MPSCICDNNSIAKTLEVEGYDGRLCRLPPTVRPLNLFPNKIVTTKRCLHYPFVRSKQDFSGFHCFDQILGICCVLHIQDKYLKHARVMVRTMYLVSLHLVFMSAAWLLLRCESSCYLTLIGRYSSTRIDDRDSCDSCQYRNNVSLHDKDTGIEQWKMSFSVSVADHALKIVFGASLSCVSENCI